MTPLTETMRDWLVAAPPAAGVFDRTPIELREGTMIALETRGLIETRPVWMEIRGRRQIASWEWRRTTRGDTVAAALVLERERFISNRDPGDEHHVREAVTS